MSKRGKEPTSVVQVTTGSQLPRIPETIMKAMSHFSQRKPLNLHARKPRSSKSGITRRDLKKRHLMKLETVGKEADAMVLPREPLDRLFRSHTGARPGEAGRTSEQARYLFTLYVHNHLNRLLHAGGRIRAILRDGRRLQPRHLFCALKSAQVMGYNPPGAYPLKHHSANAD